MHVQPDAGSLAVFVFAVCRVANDTQGGLWSANDADTMAASIFQRGRLQFAFGLRRRRNQGRTQFGDRNSRRWLCGRWSSGRWSGSRSADGRRGGGWGTEKLLCPTAQQFRKDIHANQRQHSQDRILGRNPAIQTRNVLHQPIPLMARPLGDGLCIVVSAKHPHDNDRQNVAETIADSARTSRVTKKARLEKQIIQRGERRRGTSGAGSRQKTDSSTRMTLAQPHIGRAGIVDHPKVKPSSRAPADFAITLARRSW